MAGPVYAPCGPKLVENDMRFTSATLAEHGVDQGLFNFIPAEADGQSYLRIWTNYPQNKTAPHSGGYRTDLICVRGT
jgi:hypothetical protein